MSPPEPDPKKMERRHKPALRGMVLAVMVTVLAIFLVITFGTSEEVDEAAPAAEATE